MLRNPPLASTFPDVAKEWHPSKNGKLTPENISAYAADRVWWICLRNSNHEQLQAPASRVRTGCPRCALGERSLAVMYPELAKQWHSELNLDLSPSDVAVKSNKKAWWKCEVSPEHVWEATISSRSNGCGCPFCAGNRCDSKTSLWGRFPEIAAEWHPTKNGKLKPQDVHPTTKKKVWWLCKEGVKVNQAHEWQAFISSRIQKGTGCPHCPRRPRAIKSLQTLFPDIAKEWHPTKNRLLYAYWLPKLKGSGSDNKKNPRLTPSDIAGYSNEIVWWQCSRDRKHEWQAPIENRTRQGHGCPFCSGRRACEDSSLKALHPAIARMWHPSRNKELKPADVRPHSRSAVWWRCPKVASHVWSAKIYSVVNNIAAGGRGCPFCAGKKVSKDNCLETKYPEIARMWHASRNAPLSPSAVTPGSNKEVWWRCSQSSTHIWKAKVTEITRTWKNGHTGCPFCAGRKADAGNNFIAMFPELLKYWDKERNRLLRPDQFTHGSRVVVWWRCPRSGHHAWKRPIHKMTQRCKTGAQLCPFCAKIR